MLMHYGQGEVEPTDLHMPECNEPTDLHMPECNEVLVASKIWFGWVPYGWAMMELCWYRWN